VLFRSPQGEIGPIGPIGPTGPCCTMSGSQIIGALVAGGYIGESISQPGSYEWTTP